MMKKVKYFLLFAIIIILLIGYFYAQSQRRKREQNSRYTIGIVIEKFTSKSGSYLKTKYSVDKNEYIKNFNSFGDPKPVGRKYFIKFEKGNPENAEIIKDFWANPDAVAPDTGWLKIPGIPDDKQP